MAQTKASNIAHPVRVRLILTAMGRELTTQQIAALLPDVPRTSIYRHVRELTETGVFIVTAERHVRGTVEKTYSVNLRAATLGKQDLKQAGHEEYSQLVASFLGGMIDVYQAYLARREDGLYENTLLRVNSVNLTDEEFQRFRFQLTDLLSSIQSNPLTPGRRRRVIGLLGVPDQADPPSEETNEALALPSSFADQINRGEP